MKINLQFQYNKKTELERIADTCADITLEFFQKNRYFLFNKLIPNRSRFIHLPQLEFTKVPNYWKEIKILSKIPVIKNRSNLPIIDQMDIFDIDLINNKDLQIFEKLLKQHIPRLETQLAKIYENLDIKEITAIIKPTLYGAQRTFSKPTFADGVLTIDFLYLRIDSNFQALASMIVAPIIMYTLDNPWNDAYWQEKNSITQYLMHHTSLSLLGDGYKRPKYKDRQEYITQKQVEQSNDYYDNLGFPIKSKLSISENGHLCLNKKVIKDLSATESSILKGFIRHKQKLMDYEKIGDIIWNNNSNKYSLWAVTKHMQRVRKKLKILDRNGGLIQTIKGKGYILYD